MTTLVDAFCARVAGESSLWLARGQCLNQHGAGEAYLLVLEALGQLCHGAPPLVARLVQQAPTWLQQLPALLGPAALEVLLPRVLPVHGASKQHERECLVACNQGEILSVEGVQCGTDLSGTHGEQYIVDQASQTGPLGRLLAVDPGQHVARFAPVPIRGNHHPTCAFCLAYKSCDQALPNRI
jgi:hypothetical protein